MSNKTKPVEISFQKADKHLRKVNAHIFLNVFLSYALNAVHSTNIYTYLWACQYERGSIWYFIKLSIVCTEMLQNRTAFDRIAKEVS